MPLGVYLPMVHWFSDLNQFCNFIKNVKSVLCLFVVFLLSFSNCIDSFSFFHFFFEKCWNWSQNCLWISFFSKLSTMIIIIIDPFVQKKPKLYFSKYFFQPIEKTCVSFSQTLLQVHCDHWLPFEMTFWVFVWNFTSIWRMNKMLILSF